MDQSKALVAFSALANADRLALIRLLVPLGPEGMAAGDIARTLGLSASRLSFHLTQLQQAGLLRSRRVARHVIYTADFEGLGAIASFLLQDCCCDSARIKALCHKAAAE